MATLLIENLLLRHRKPDTVELTCVRCGASLEQSEGARATQMVVARLLRWSTDHPPWGTCR